MTDPAPLTRAVLDFWFLPPDHPGHGAYRPEWFRKDEAFDAAIRERFGAAVDAALNGSAPVDAPDASLLATILLLDQFTRNIFRGTPQAFAGDPQALQIAESLVASGRDKNLPPWQRWFAYLPFRAQRVAARAGTLGRTVHRAGPRNAARSLRQRPRLRPAAPRGDRALRPLSPIATPSSAANRRRPRSSSSKQPGSSF
jgi:uncharacterized protein (DUF924 family)